MNLSFHGKGEIVVNGISYSGTNVSIIGGIVTVDGVLQKNSFEEKILIISIDGRVDSLTTASGSVTVHGDCSNVETVSGDIVCGDVVNGSVQSVSGSVKAGTIHGKVSTISGNIRKN